MSEKKNKTSLEERLEEIYRKKSDENEALKKLLNNLEESDEEKKNAHNKNSLNQK